MMLASCPFRTNLVTVSILNRFYRVLLSHNALSPVDEPGCAGR